ncbi:MAG TPA: hypothetical protein VJ833_09080 [Rhodanobacteraceae bacterium]|nr:hypothetical protein [Rhodanobacteraceae bacterium]
MSTDQAACSTARISITVSDFHEIGRGSSRADMELIDTGHGTVSQGRINDPIVVTAEAHLEFSVSAREGDRYTYSPVGISFKETSDAASDAASDQHCGGRDPLGHAAFPTRRFVSRGSTLQLSLFDANPEPGEFKFDLVIQRSDGALGVLDPGIENRGVMK